MGRVIDFPRRVSARPLAKCVAMPLADMREPLCDVELVEHGIAVRVPFASSIIDPETARIVAWKLLHLANEHDARSGR